MAKPPDVTDAWTNRDVILIGGTRIIQPGIVAVSHPFRTASLAVESAFAHTIIRIAIDFLVADCQDVAERQT
jgi:hypothetical protein